VQGCSCFAAFVAGRWGEDCPTGRTILGVNVGHPVVTNVDFVA